MKILILILLLPFSSIAQSFEGAWGLKWGINMDSAISIIKMEKGIIPVINKTDTISTLVYSKAKWGIKSSSMTRLEFLNNHLYAVYAFFIPDVPAEFIETYGYLKKMISNKYGFPQKDIEDYKEPYSVKDAENKKAYAILSGYGTLACVWNFSISPNTEEIGNIILNFSKDSGIVLWYKDGDVSKSVSEGINKKIMRDF